MLCRVQIAVAGPVCALYICGWFVYPRREVAEYATTHDCHKLLINPFIASISHDNSMNRSPAIIDLTLSPTPCLNQQPSLAKVWGKRDERLVVANKKTSSDVCSFPATKKKKRVVQARLLTNDTEKENTNKETAVMVQFRKIGASTNWQVCNASPAHLQMVNQHDRSGDDSFSVTLERDSKMSMLEADDSLQVARLDDSISCSICDACHPYYLMYPAQDSRRGRGDTRGRGTALTESQQYRCALCWRYSDDAITSAEDAAAVWCDSDVTPSSFPIRRRSTISQQEMGTTSSPAPHHKSSSSSNTKSSSFLVGPESCNTQGCLDMLHAIEDELEIAALSLTQDAIQTLEANIRRELQSLVDDDDEDVVEFVQQTVADEVEQVRELWQTHWDLLIETCQVLHAGLTEDEEEEGDVLLSYYQWRAGQQAPLTGGDPPRWKTFADQALNQRDVKVGMGPGQFWGATGMICLVGRFPLCPFRTRQLLLTTNMLSFIVLGVKGEKPRCSSGQQDIIDEVEEIATLRDSQNYRMFPIRRGFGWNSEDDWNDAELMAAEHAAYEEEDSMDYRVRTEREDKELQQRAGNPERRTVLILYKEERPKYHMMPPQKVNHGFVRPPKASTQSNRATKTKSIRATTAKRPNNGATTATNEIRAIAAIQPPSAKRKRAPRNCQRCLHFGGEYTTLCKGSKGGFGQKHCEYFTLTGDNKL
jgi:hypothetical protein